MKNVKNAKKTRDFTKVCMKDHEEDEGYEGMHEGAHEDEEEEGFTKEEIEELAQLIGSSITEKKKAKFADDDDEYESVHEGVHEEEEGMHEGEHEEVLR